MASDLILKQDSFEAAADRALGGLSNPLPGDDFREVLERMAMDTIATRSARKIGIRKLPTTAPARPKSSAGSQPKKRPTAEPTSTSVGKCAAT